jgi:hypothetical protein
MPPCFPTGMPMLQAICSGLRSVFHECCSKQWLLA